MYKIILKVGELEFEVDNNNAKDRTHKTLSPTLEMEENSFGSLSFTLPRQNECYQLFDTDIGSSIFNSEIFVALDTIIETEPIFRGRLLEIKRDSQLNRQVVFEGELSYLADSIQEPAKYDNVTPDYYVGKLLEVHNRKFPDRQFAKGVITVTDDNSADHITGRVNRGSYSVSYSNTTWSCLQSLANELGGHFKVRWENGVRYLDYLKDYDICDQTIEFGKNLLDYAEEWTLSELCTVLVPIGADMTVKYTDQDGKEASETVTTTIANVNNGSVYLECYPEILAKYGRREKMVEFRGISDPGHLKAVGALYLNNIQFDNMVLNLTALDMYELGLDPNRITFLSKVTAVAWPFWTNPKQMPVTKISLPLKDPAHAVYSMATNSRGIRSLSTKITDYDADAQEQIDDIKDDVEDLKKELKKYSMIQSTTPNDWEFGIPEIVFPEDEASGYFLWHSTYMTRAWDALESGAEPVTEEVDRPNLTDQHQPVCIGLKEAHLKKYVDDRLKITHGLNTSTTWADIDNSEVAKGGPVKFPKGTNGIIPINTRSDSHLEDGCKVLYLVVSFKPGTLGCVAFEFANSSYEFCSNNDGYLCVVESGNLSPIPVYRNGTAYIPTSTPVVLAFSHGVKSTEKHPFSDGILFGTITAELGNLLSGVYSSSKFAEGEILDTADGVNLNYNSPFEPDGFDPDHPAAGDDDHEIGLIRAVECYSNIPGQITMDEVYENIAWLVGRFVTGTITSDAGELPDFEVLSEEVSS